MHQLRKLKEMKPHQSFSSFYEYSCSANFASKAVGEQTTENGNCGLHLPSTFEVISATDASSPCIAASFIRTGASMVLSLGSILSVKDTDDGVVALYLKITERTGYLKRRPDSSLITVD